MKANDLHNFRFEAVSGGCYKVTYTTDERGDYWTACIDEMSIIDKTKNAMWAKTKDIKWLRYLVKKRGAHYDCMGKRLN